MYARRVIENENDGFEELFLISFSEVTTEAEMLRIMSGWSPLPCDVDSEWISYRNPAWIALFSLMAAADVSGERGWQQVALRVFDFAADWDVFDRMQGIRHGPEKAWPDTEAFARALENLMTSDWAGTRLWVARELGILRSAGSLDVLVTALSDPHVGVAEEAAFSISMLAQKHAAAREVSARPKRA